MKVKILSLVLLSVSASFAYSFAIPNSMRIDDPLFADGDTASASAIRIPDDADKEKVREMAKPVARRYHLQRTTK